MKEKFDKDSVTEARSPAPQSRNIESVRNLIRKLELYERSQYISQKEEERNFVVALKRWLDGDDYAIDDWLATL